MQGEVLSLHIHTPIDSKMMADIQVTVGRLIAKAGQLIGNFTSNLAEVWMHMRCKFDGGKVINRSQSGSFQHRCMGAGLRQTLGGLKPGVLLSVQKPMGIQKSSKR